MIISKSPMFHSLSKGMNNVRKKQGLDSEEKTYSPHVIFNMDHTPHKTLIKREGYEKVLSFSNTHSLWSDSTYLYFCAEGLTSYEAIYRYDGSSVTLFTPVTGRLNPMYFLRVGDYLFMSSKVWNKVYHYPTDTFMDWVSTDSGAFDFRESDDLLAFGNSPVPPMEHLTFFRSRIFGSRGRDVFYTDPFAYFWFKEYNVITVSEPVTMLAPLNSDGMYIASANITWFMEEKEGDSHGGSSHFSLTIVGSGAVKNTLSYGDFHGVDGLPIRSPFWVNKHGICVGVKGTEHHLSVHNLAIPTGESGASVFYRNNSVPKYIATIKNPLPSTLVSDNITVEVFRNGRLITS